MIDAGVRTAETISRYQDDPEATDAFIAVLAEGKLFSERERKLGLASPKLSKLRTIGAHAALLRCDEVLGYFLQTGISGYSVIFQLVVLYNNLQGDDEARFEQLVKVLREKLPSSREAFSELSKQARKEKTLAERDS